jgi:hypothetical protein
MGIHSAVRETTELRAGGPFGLIRESSSFPKISFQQPMKLAVCREVLILRASSFKKWRITGTTVAAQAADRERTSVRQAVSF